MAVPYRNKQTAYQRLQEDLDYKLDRMNQYRQAAFDAVNQPANQSRPTGRTEADVYNNTVRRQRQLQKMGYYKGAIDGKWGSGSRGAHEAALKNGYILNSQGIYVRKPGAQKRVTPDAYTATEQQQAQLKQLGFYKGNIDNKFGSQSRAAHQAALDAGFKYENGVYKKPVREQQQKIDEATFRSQQLSTPLERTLGKVFPAIRQVWTTFTGADSGKKQTNKDFSDKYLENLSQLGQVAYRQYVRKNGYPNPYEPFILPLTPGVYKEINPSGNYADFTDLGAIANAAIGGNRQVEYTDGAMSGTAYIDEVGNVHWNATDDAHWTFDSDEYKQKFKNDAKAGNIGSAVRYGMGKVQEQQDSTGYVPVAQNFDIVFPRDTITANPARYSNVPRYKQKK